MPITTISSREFNQDLSRAKRATKDGPVFITDRGRPAHVLLSIEEYHKVKGSGMGLAAAVGMPFGVDGVEDFDFHFPRAEIQLKPVDFERCFCSTPTSSQN